MSRHLPVLLNEVLEILAPRAGASLLDCTFGGGGHTRALLEAAEGVRVTALDCDPEAAKRAEILKAEYGERFTFIDVNFGDLEELPENVDGFAGALFDFGVSSFQLDTPERGFSFRFEGPADMRLNPREGRSAALFLETATREELVTAIRDYGEEPRWKQVVQAIINARGTGKLADTATLAALIGEAAEWQQRRQGRAPINPATLSFQGIRMAVNDELGVIERALPAAFERMAEDGVLAVISFHSLEDRIVKRAFRRLAGMPEHRHDSEPQQFRTRQGELLTRRPITPTEEETSVNPRARSARLRAIRKETQ